MNWTSLHSQLLSTTFEKLLGNADSGTMAFVRCLTPDVIEALALDRGFAPTGWSVLRVADSRNLDRRTITADEAVEIRESKREATVLLVDTSRAGAGMDGIYSAAKEINESELFKEALRLAARQVTNQQGKSAREFAERAVKKARGFGQLYSVSPWQEFDFFVRIVSQELYPGELLNLLGIWPTSVNSIDPYNTSVLDVSRLFVDRLLGTYASSLTPSQRIESLRLLDVTEQQRIDLERFLHSAATKPLLPSLEKLSEFRHLYVNELKLEGAAQLIQKIDLVPWKTIHGKLAKWTGLTEENESEPSVLILDPNANTNGNYAKLEVRWKARPENLEKESVQYHVRIITDMDEELASRDVSHSAKKEEKCRFTDDDFSMLSDDALINARVVISVIGNESVNTQESDEFVIRYGTPPDKGAGGVGKIVRTFSEGIIELEDREDLTAISLATDPLPIDSKGYLLLRTKQRGKNFRVFYPPMIREVEKDWVSRNGELGRWRVSVRASGIRAKSIEFVSFTPPDVNKVKILWDRVSNASRKMAERFSGFRGVGQVYDQNAKALDTVVKEYLLAWTSLLEEGDPAYALANTVEVQSLAGRTIGLIVLPGHPLRLAWHSAYDNLVLHTRYEQNASPTQIRDELKSLDGSMFPAFLPGVEKGKTFVYADTLGFHSVGMVVDDDPEPKAAMAILSRALGESDSAKSAPTVGHQSANVLGNEILKYIECHDTSKILQVHALRPGDGLTVARSLGHVQKRCKRLITDDYEQEDIVSSAPSFLLELYPSNVQRGVSGRFIAEAREKRRSGAGVVLEEDQWMLESTSLPGGMTLPRLRWARKGDVRPKTAAHLAVAFDTFDSLVVPEETETTSLNRPYFAFGLVSFFERIYRSLPSPLWRSTAVFSSDGEKHPADRMHTDRLAKLQQILLVSAVRNLGAMTGIPVLRTEISPEKADSLLELHRVCDWVITLDRNAGIEYFDSPHDNREVYDAYVIDCVPEREDLGCLQLITSTSNLDEVRNLLDGAFDRMGLSRSRRNAEFLLGHLKSLSGRLAIRLTGQKAPTSELIALAMCHANCLRADEDQNCWLALRNGFFIPVDDIRDLLPPAENSDSLKGNSENEEVEKLEGRSVRPDLIYVCSLPRKGLLLRFVEVKYRRHLRMARSPETLENIRQQIESLRSRWEDWYSSDDIPQTFRALRRAKLARVLRFYADKARRHADDEKDFGLTKDSHQTLVAEIDRMIEKGEAYSFPSISTSDRGWIFCPEFAGNSPLEITPAGWETRVFLFGPATEHYSPFNKQPVNLSGLENETFNEGRTETNSFNSHGLQDFDREASQEVFLSSSGSRLQPESAIQNSGEPVSDSEGTPSISLGSSTQSGADVRWPLTIKGNPHLLIAGLPGMGKTTCLLSICRQMTDAGVTPIVFSYHQDIDEKLQQSIGAVRFIDFDGLGFNPLQVIDRASRMAYLDVAGAVRDIFCAIYPELGDIQGERIRRAIKESFLELGWDDRNADLTSLSVPDFSRFVDILKSDPKPDRGLKSLLSRFDELADYEFFNTVDQWSSLWDSKTPIVLRIHTTQNENLQKAFASLVFYSLYKDMFRRGIQNRITHALIFDEAHRAARLQLIPTMAKECRKYGISLVLASQEARDFNISLFSAIANYLVLRLTEVDAKALARNVASSDMERMLIDRIKQLDRFKAFYCSEGLKKPVQLLLHS